MAEKPVYGGHDCEFVQQVSDRLNCNICTKVLRDPELAVCCGQHFCESCLNKWFAKQGKESCPYCRAEGEAFHHVIHKGLRSEINQLKIRCSNHGEGCQWTGELGELKKHLESDNGCGFVIVDCPNKCRIFDITTFNTSLLKRYRKDMCEHLANECYLRPYQCKFCGLKDTYEAITGDGYLAMIRIDEDDYYGHRAECPEVPLRCPNKCGANKIKRKDMKRHRNQCPKELLECPFAEAGCKVEFHRHRLEHHMTSNQQQHLLMLMKSYWTMKDELDKTKNELDKMKNELDKTKNGLNETKNYLQITKNELHETKIKLSETEAKLAMAEDRIAWSNKLQKEDDFVRFGMPNFTEYHRSGTVWHSPPFYYGGGYKMCLAVYANGVGEGAGTHVSVAVLHLRGEYDDQLTWPMQTCLHGMHKSQILSLYLEGQYDFLVCHPLERQLIHKCEQLDCCDKFCRQNGRYFDGHFVNDCLTFHIEFNICFVQVRII